jgi:hypothetical protein
MSRYKRTRITTATREVIAIRQKVTAPGPVCPLCGKTVWLELDEAIARCSLSARGIFRLVEDGVIHFREPVDGRSLVCSNSLTKYLIEKER